MILFAFILLKVSIFERRAGSGAAGDQKINVFQLKSFEKVSIFERRAGSGAAGDRKINDF